MTRYLWTGESEYCTCGHHVTDHETCQSQSFIAIAKQQQATTTVICRGGEGEEEGKGNGSKVRIIRGCHCDEFRPYRIATTEDDNKVIEKQIWEVRKE